ncbi:MAG: hypothetical protein K8T89_14115 [Planctomycetes bacterium]|nr:hypothetical protein [Planctomycetota bacterium]
MKDIEAEVQGLCETLKLNCVVNIYPREAVSEIPPGIDLIITFVGEGKPPAPLVTLRQHVETAMTKRRLEVLPWISMSRPLNGQHAHCLAFAQN